MWHQKPMQLILKISYYKALLLAVPTALIDINTWKFHPSRIYTIYCAIMHLGYLALAPFIYIIYFYEPSFLSGKPILRSLLIVRNTCRMFLIIVFIVGFWMRRASMIAFCKSVEDFRWNYQLRLCSTMPGSMEAKYKIDLIMSIKYCISSIHFLVMGYNILKINSVDDNRLLNASAISLILITVLLLTIIDDFCNILTQLWMYFECVNQSLRSLILQLKALDHSLSLGASEMCMRHRARSLQRHLTELSAMHYHCLRLTQRFFKIWELRVAFMITNISLSNIYMLYYWFLLHNESLKTEYFFNNLNSFLTTVTFYVGTILLIEIIEALLTANNMPGLLLQECSDLLQLRRCVTTKLTQSLEQFSLELKCRRLSFSICGLFNLDRKMAVKCLVWSLLQVIVIVQYELQSQLKHK